MTTTRFGPGTFKLGTAPGTDYSCQVQSMGLTPTKDEGDPITPLCGDTVPGGISYTYSLAGTFLQDLGAATGLSQYCWANAGTAQAFEFTPSTGAATKVAGTVVVDPLDIGASDAAYGDVLTADFEFTCVGKPTVTWPAG